MSIALDHRRPQADTEDTTTREAVAQQKLLLQCPRCKTDLAKMDCLACGFQMQIRDGIIYALPPERADRYARFIKDYEHIRAAEGRGSQRDNFYLALPYKDISGRNSKQWNIRSRSYDYLVKRILSHEHNHELILDLGAGNCWMSFRLAQSGYSPVAVDLLTNREDGLGAATHFHPYLNSPISRFQAELAHLPFQEEQFDAIVFNASFHYSEDYEATLREALRCLKPGGKMIISDTPWYSKEESGRTMVMERNAIFRERFQTASDSVHSLEYLTDARLQALEKSLPVRWVVHKPWYGWAWATRPWIAKLRRRREPSQFRIYVAKKDA